MKNNKIKYNLKIDKKLGVKQFKKISTKTMTDVCQIIGVFLDNAIEEVKNINDGSIMINMYLTEEINIEIINSIGKYFDVNKIDKTGYTTKEGVHGYGLTLVNRILKDNKLLKNEREINEKTFKQKLIIK